MTDNILPHDAEHADRQIMKYLKLMRLHHELSSLYRTKSKDRRTISNLWYLIDGLELDLRSEGVAL
jgi:hypothetical protein